VELFLSIPQEQAYAIRQKLLEALGAENTSTVRNKIGDAVAEVAREYSDNSRFCI
jgi:importin-5